MYPENADALRRLGMGAARLLAPQPPWIRRRKEKVTLLDESTVRRQLSVDFALPVEEAPTLRWRQDDVWYAPLFFLQKGSDAPFDPDAPLHDPEPHFANFDFRNEAGTALSLPPRLWNADVSTQMLNAATEQAAAHQQIVIRSRERPGIEKILGHICHMEQLQAVQYVADLTDRQIRSREERIVRELYRRDESLRCLVDACAIASVVMVPLIGEDALTGIVKLSYDEQVTSIRPPGPARRVLAAFGWFGYELWVDAPFIGASKYHFEMQAPDGLEIYDAGLVPVGGQADRTHAHDQRTVIARSSGFGTRLHLYAPDATRSAKAFAWIRLRVRRHEFVGGAVLASFLVALVLWIAWDRHGDAQDAPAGIPTLLLLFPGAIAAYAARPDAHRLTARMLQGARHLLQLSAALPFVAAGAFALARREGGVVVDEAFADWWLVTAIVATIVWALLVVGRFFPQPQIRRRRWADALGLDMDRRERREHPEPWLRRVAAGKRGVAIRSWRRRLARSLRRAQ